MASVTPTVVGIVALVAVMVLAVGGLVVKHRIQARHRSNRIAAVVPAHTNA